MPVSTRDTTSPSKSVRGESQTSHGGPCPASATNTSSAAI